MVGIGLLVVVVVGAFIAEQVARSATLSTIRSSIIEQLGLPADQQMDISVPGLVLPQLIGGRLDQVQVSSDEVSFDGLSGAIEVTATGVPVRGEAAADAASARLTLDEAQLRALLARVPNIPVETVTLEPDGIAMTAELNVVVTTLEVGVTLGVRAEEGDIVLTPNTVSVGGAELSAPALLEQFGPVAESVLGSYTVCVADQLPAGLTLADVSVADAVVVANVDIDGRILSDEALQQPGLCAG